MPEHKQRPPWPQDPPSSPHPRRAVPLGDQSFHHPFPCSGLQNPRFLREGLEYPPTWPLKGARTREKASKGALVITFGKSRGVHFSLLEGKTTWVRENSRKMLGRLIGLGQRTQGTERAPSSHLGASRSSIFRRGCREETSPFPAFRSARRRGWLLNRAASPQLLQDPGGRRHSDSS